MILRAELGSIKLKPVLLIAVTELSSTILIRPESAAHSMWIKGATTFL
jgi:hypothetical protein